MIFLITNDFSRVAILYWSGICEINLSMSIYKNISSSRNQTKENENIKIKILFFISMINYFS